MVTVRPTAEYKAVGARPSTPRRAPLRSLRFCVGLPTGCRRRIAGDRSAPARGRTSNRPTATQQEPAIQPGKRTCHGPVPAWRRSPPSTSCRQEFRARSPVKGHGRCATARRSALDRAPRSEKEALQEVDGSIRRPLEAPRELEFVTRPSNIPLDNESPIQGPGMRVLPHPAKPPMPSPLTPLPNGREGRRPPPKCPRLPRLRRCWRLWRKPRTSKPRKPL